ncbi:MAG TPA: TonB-dependent receptor plug domain-containing protein, partial [Candidatus Polarisedimenticolia bacterium]|nr:TonB-dependent receptor plug domain-containing protein [Candidatus Polarisedimenticolia bacterium]
PASEATEHVRVKGTTSVVDTESAVTSTRFSSEFIADLPILGRDYQDILVLAPGVTDVNHTGNPNIHGARDVDEVTLVDGVSTTDPFTGLYGQNLNIESIQEIEVITSAATAQYSRAQGGFASILTKSGGNEFKGTFKAFVRSDRLDRDGAGVDDPELSGGFPGAHELSEMSFTDLKPYLSVSGAMLRDKLWYYASGEFIQEETPVNALTEVFLFRTRGYRGFLKSTWQMSAANRMALSIIADRHKDENQGINSLKDVSSGYSTFRGGPTYTLKQTSTFNPDTLLESSVAWFDNRFGLTPTLDPDTNHNGILFVDDRRDLGGDGDGFLEPKERDPGEDWDVDGHYDVFEDANHNLHLDTGEDLDGDGRLLYQYGCEGFRREDFNCNGVIDREVDRNANGKVEPEEDTGIPCAIPGLCPNGVAPNTADNHRFDTEDRNGDGRLDTLENSGFTPIPFWTDRNFDGKVEPGEFRAPLPPDMDLTRDKDGRYFGPFPLDFHDHRKRASWLEEMSFFVSDFGGTHDLKTGFAYEHEGYESDTNRRPNLFYPVENLRFATRGAPPDVTKGVPQTGSIVALPGRVINSATGDNLGLYFQDTYKPFPNFTLSFGLRFDFENLKSFGFRSFDPAAERSAYDVLMSLSGVDVDPWDKLFIQGLCRDPVHSCTGSGDLRGNTISSRLREIAFQGMTRHNLDVDVFSSSLGIVSGGTPLGSAPARIRRPEHFGITNSNLAPRLSLSWDPWADGKSKVFASWGRYYGKLFLATAVLEQGPDTVSRSYMFDEDGVDDRGLPDNRLGNVLSQSTLSATQVDRNLSTPYTDEWTAGIERELGPEMALSLRYIRRDFNKQLQDVDVNHHIALDPYTGAVADRIGSSLCEKNDRGGLDCQNVPDGLPDLYINNFFFNRIYRLGNYNDQDYRAWEVELVRRLHRKWQLEASYTYSIAQGGAESFLSQIGDDPSLTEWETGYLNYDQRHVIKLNAIAYLPGNWRLGGAASWSSGLPYSTIANQAATDDVGFLQNRTIFGYLGSSGFDFHRERRNVHRNPATYLLNARLQKDFVIGKSSAAGFFEIYNLLNTDDLRLSYLAVVPPHVQPAQQPGFEDHWVPGFMTTVGERDFGRRFQVGIQINF